MKNPDATTATRDAQTSGVHRAERHGAPGGDRPGLPLALHRWPRRLLPDLICSAAVLLGSIAVALPAHAQTRLSNAAYASAAPLFRQIDAAFAADYKKQTGRDVRVETKAGADAAQVQAVRDGLAADVVVLSDARQLDALTGADFVPPDWRAKYPNQAAPWGTTIAFVVRAGNPKRIKDWPDLARSAVRVLMPDPALDATGRFAWLSAWGAQRQAGRTEAQTAQQAAGLLKNAAPLTASFEAAVQAFHASDRADVLLALESELPALRGAAGNAAFEVIRPPRGLFIGHPVAAVERTTRKKGTAELAKAYLSFLFTPAAQAMAAAQGLRIGVPAEVPDGNHRTQAGRKKPAGDADSRLFTLDDAFGSAAAAEQAQFGAGGWLQRLRAKAVNR